MPSSSILLHRRRKQYFLFLERLNRIIQNRSELSDVLYKMRIRNLYHGTGSMFHRLLYVCIVEMRVLGLHLLLSTTCLCGNICTDHGFLETETGNSVRVQNGCALSNNELLDLSLCFAYVCVA
jgi:hypothetical protein